jgi:molecular chaperone GrpE
MSDAPLPEDDLPSTVEIVAESDLSAPADVEVVLPPPAVASVATEDVPEPEMGPQAFVDRSDEILGAVREIEDTLGRRLEALQTLFDREIRAEATREKIVDRLHAELQEYKNDLLLNTLRPVFIDLIQLHDDMGKIVESQAGDDGSRYVEFIRGFQQGIEDILYRQGVEPFLAEGDAFDPRRQRAVATVVTDDPARVRTVAARHRKGFLAGEKVIRAEIVSVYTLAK